MTWLGANNRGFTPHSVGPLNLPLVTSNPNYLFSYLGSYNLPSAFAYGSGGMSVAVVGGQKVMYVSGNQSSNINCGSCTAPTQAQVEAGFTPATVVSPVNVNNKVNINQAASSSLLYVTGTYVLNNTVYMTGTIFYPSGGPSQQTGFVWTADTGLTTFGTPCSAIGSAGHNSNGLYGGPVAPVPSIWQALLGGPHFIASGLGDTQVQSACVGFGFSTLDLTKVSSSGGSVNVNELTNYPYGNKPAHQSWNSTPIWSRPNCVGSVSGTALTVTSITSPWVNIGLRSPLLAAVNATQGDWNFWVIGGTGTGGVGNYTLNAAPGDFTNQPMYLGNTAVGPNTTGTSPGNCQLHGGDDLASIYDGNLGHAVIPNGTRSLLFVSIHHYGPHIDGKSTLNCDSGASGSSDPRRFQITAFDLNAIYTGIQSGQSPTSFMPYNWWDPGWANSIFGGASCPGRSSSGVDKGFACYDPIDKMFLMAPMGQTGSPPTVYCFAFNGN